MKTCEKVFVIIFAFIIYTGLGFTNVLAADMEWNQFRLNSENNPVISNNSISSIEQIITTNNEIRSTPVVVGNKIFIGNHDSGDISAYNLETKELLWESKAPNWIHSEIIYVKNQLFVGYGNRFMQKDIRGTGESGLLSLDPKTGEILWDFKTEGHVMPTPAVYKGTIYITTGDRQLYGIDPENGTEKWSLNLGSIVSMSSPVIKDGVLYVGGTKPSIFFAVDLDHRKIKWKKPLKDVVLGIDDVPPVISDDGIVYTTAIKETDEPVTIRNTFSQNGTIAAYKQGIKLLIGPIIKKGPSVLYEHSLYGINAEDGEIVWQTSLGKGPMVPNNKSGAPMLYNNSVFVGSPITKSFYSFNAKSGEQLWKYESHVNKAPPVANNNIVYFTDVKGLVYGFDTNTGELLGKKLLGGKLSPSGPILVNDNLIVGSQDKNVYIVATKDILESNDNVSNGKEESLFSFITLVYLLPTVILTAFVSLLIYIIKRVKKKK